MSYENLSIEAPSRRWKKRALACYRLGVILVALLCLRMLPRSAPQLDHEKILAEALTVFSSTASLGEVADGMIPLLNRDATVIGWATSTFPEANQIQGYSGPSELLVILDANRVVKAVRFLNSTDTQGHVAKVRADSDFWQQWTGKNEASLSAAERPRIVSGATLTSEAMARGVAARFGAQGMEQWFPALLTLGDVSKWFPKADRIAESKAAGIYQIFSGQSELGTILRSSRMGISARGYNGISDVIVALDIENEKVLGIGLLGSRDNEPYVGDVKNEVMYADGFAGKSVEEIIAGAPAESPFLFTSGASYTNHAVVQSVSEMLRRHQAVRSTGTFPWKSAVSFVWIGLGLFVGLHRKGGGRRVRLGFAIISVIAGVSLGWMVSQDQLIGWGINGIGIMAAPVLLALTAVALLVPAFTGKNVYCSRICPHGAAQTLAGQAIRRRFSMPPKIHAIMSRVPWVTLVVIWLLALLGSGLPFAYFEPFEMWSTGFVAFIPAAIFTIGLLAAFFLPQAYCHYGCPTGALLKFLTHAPGRWTMRDTIAGILVASAAVFTLLR